MALRFKGVRAGLESRSSLSDFRRERNTPKRHGKRRRQSMSPACILVWDGCGSARNRGGERGKRRGAPGPPRRHSRSFEPAHGTLDARQRQSPPSRRPERFNMETVAGLGVACDAPECATRFGAQLPGHHGERHRLGIREPTHVVSFERGLGEVVRWLETTPSGLDTR